MATRAQALIPITIAAAIVGIVGLAAVPDDVKLESVDFPRGTIALDGKFLEVQTVRSEQHVTCPFQALPPILERI